jgi:tetratricopeptide (TPR) repeat protein
LLKLGQDEAALRCFRRTLELEYSDDIELMLQVGRSLFREGSLRERPEFFEAAKEFFETAVQQMPDSAEAIACVAYTQHRLADDDAAIGSLRRSLQQDNDHAEARISLANILYDQNEYEAALYHFERTEPDDHWDELGIWRLVELKRSLYRLEENDPELKPWDERLSELAADMDDVDALLMELEPQSGANAAPGAETARGQLELFGSLLSSLAEQKHAPEHQIIASDGTEFDGSWEEIVRHMRDQTGNPSDSVHEFMTGASQRSFRQTGVRIPTHDAESFLRGSAVAGLLRIVR